MANNNLGYKVVTRADLLVRDYSVYPFDRPIAPYKIMIDGVISEVVGTWGDYLRDLDAKRVVIERPPLNNSEKTMDEMIITDIFVGIPDNPHITDPLLQF
jgi:hypothetical protein